MKRSEVAIVVILRVLGLFALGAIPAIVMPFSWMNTIHGLLGLGELPDAPIVSYLARSLSMFYAMFGIIVIFASYDLRQNWTLVTLLAVISILLGVTLFGIDIVAQMPLHWTLLEGPFTIIVGVTILILQRQAGPASHGPVSQ